jgi:hypothetical protein
MAIALLQYDSPCGSGSESGRGRNVVRPRLRAGVLMRVAVQ